jgi:transcriptional regulator with XRE-family HTH domain
MRQAERDDQNGPQRPDWSSRAARVRWLIDTRFKGNRSRFAEAIGLSHTAVNKVAAGGQEPGLKLLTAIREALRVSPAWLLDGEGQPFRDPSDLDSQGVPMTEVLLPGPPLEHMDQVTGGLVQFADRLFTPTQYWLRLTSDQPLVRKRHLGFRAGDRLLMETDRVKFPREEKLFSRLCVVRFPDEGGRLRLAAVTHYDADPDTGPAHLEADPFEHDTDEANLITEVAYRHHPSGEITRHERQFLPKQVRGRTVAVPLDEMTNLEPQLPAVRYTDVVAVWLNVLHRPSGVSL